MSNFSEDCDNRAEVAIFTTLLSVMSNFSEDCDTYVTSVTENGFLSVMSNFSEDCDFVQTSKNNLTGIVFQSCPILVRTATVPRNPGGLRFLFQSCPILVRTATKTRKNTIMAHTAFSHVQF